MSTQCFRWSNSANWGTLNETDKDTPCAGWDLSQGAAPCCAKGDECLSDFFCRSTQPPTGASGYYIAGCTDQSYSSAQCSNLCTKDFHPWVVYNNEADLWNCCGSVNGGQNTPVNCSNPTAEVFHAPSPEELVQGTASASTSSASATATSSATGSASASGTTSSTTPATTAAASTMPVASSSNNKGLSGGAIAGAAVGATLGIVLILALIGLLFFRRRKAARQRTAHEPPKAEMAATSPTDHISDPNQTAYAENETKYAGSPFAENPSELESPMKHKSAELQDNRHVAELPGS